MGLAVGDDLYAFALNQPHSLEDATGLCPNYRRKDVAQWTKEERLHCIITRVAEKAPSEVKSALSELVTDDALFTTTAIFGIWAASHTTPYGWITDIAMMGVGAYFTGTAIIELVKGIYAVGKAIIKPNCLLSDINNAVSAMTDGIAAVTQRAAGGTIKAASKLSQLFRQMLKKDSPAVATKKVQKHKVNTEKFGTFDPPRQRSAKTVNEEARKRHDAENKRRGTNHPFYPPWANDTSVTDAILESGKTVYMLIDKGSDIRIGGWASLNKFTNIKEAREKLSLLKQFKKDEDCCTLLELKVKSPMPVRSGTVGPLKSKDGKESYKGGAHQYELLIDRGSGFKWTDYFEVVSTKELK